MSDLKQIEASLDSIAGAIQDSETDLGVDDIYGMNPNTNLAQIAYNLAEINKTLQKIAEKLVWLQK